MSRTVGMTGRLREDEVKSVCNPFINLFHPKSLIGQFYDVIAFSFSSIHLYL